MRPSSLRNRFSSSTLSENGSREIPFKPVLFSHRQAEIGVGLGADLEGPEALEAVEQIHDFFPILPAGRRRKFGGNLLPKRAPTGAWRSDVAGVTGAPQSDLRLIRSFPRCASSATNSPVSCCAWPRNKLGPFGLCDSVLGPP